MKIQSRKSFSVGGAGPVSVPGQASVEAVEASQPAAGDNIQISSDAQEVGELKKTLASVPEVRTNKIEGIRGQVEDGSYHVESEVLAKAVLDEHLRDAIRREKATREANA